MTRSSRILSAFIGSEIAPDVLTKRVQAAFEFPAPVAQVENDIAVLELFHGPTLAFKDFGARLWHRCWPKLLAINPSLF